MKKEFLITVIKSYKKKKIECAFRIIVKRFNVLENKMLVCPDIIIPKACCFMHKIIMNREEILI